MTYSRALTLLIGAGLPYVEADEIARDVSEREQARAEWEAAVNRKKASRAAHRRFVMATCKELEKC